jgi:hypothetical protein
MKTSNKILLGVLLAFMLILTGIHLALFAKYKSGDFASANQIPDDMERYPLPAIKYVSITGLVNCYLLPNAEKPALEINKEGKSRISYKVVGDTLVVTGDSSATKEDYERGVRNHQLVNLKLPATEQVKLAYGSLFLLGGDDSVEAPSFSIELTTHAHLGIIQREPASTKTFFNRLNLVTNNSNVELDDKTMISELNVRSVTSKLIYKQASIKHMTMDVDSHTTVTLSGPNLKNLTEISKP